MGATRTGVALRWAAALAQDEAPAAARFRASDDVEALLVGDRLWLRGTAVVDEPSALRQLLPGVQVYQVLDGDRLAAAGRRVASAHLPSGTWRPLRELLGLRLPDPRATLAGDPRPATLRLQRSASERPTAMLVTSWDAWREYAETAPRWRLETITFAASDDGRAVIRGEILPPLDGERFWEEERVAAPAGWTWRPAVAPSVVRRAVDARSDDVVLLVPAPRRGDDAAPAEERDELPAVVRVVPADAWVRGARASVRATADSLGAVETSTERRP